MDQVKVPLVKPKLLAVRSTKPPSQKVVGPLASICGLLGFGFTITVILSDTTEEQS
ncbi:hypothetical protein MYP_3386 [Sporocytophaga myxococcoides]|uniref:Uncharacterized protein n=1 Tax=Sporocytophaga myxococcoides TaxID=153721 RepID=A0A098LI73_9BACT|nr:hypothetical protein MYP_3386 [Sporocytophaga myxococcoides]